PDADRIHGLTGRPPAPPPRALASPAPPTPRLFPPGEALLGGELVPPALRAELLRTVDSDWDESDAYGLGIESITTIAAEPSPRGRAWGHLGFGLGHTTIALSSEAGDRQAVVLYTTHPLTRETWDR